MKTERSLSRKLEDFLENDFTPILLLDKSNQVRFVNSAAQELLGELGSKGTLPGQLLDRLKAEGLLTSSLPPGEQITATIRSKNEKRLRCRRFNHPELEEKLLYLKELDLDLAAKKTLRRAERQLEALGQAGAVGYWEWDVLKDQLRISDEAARAFGFEPGELPDTPSLEKFLMAIHTEDRNQVRETVEQALEDCQENFETEFRVRNVEGQQRWLVGRGLVECEGQEPVRTSGVVVDVTEQKRAQRELKDFVYSASHDLKEPLRKLRSFSDLLEHDLEEHQLELPEQVWDDLDEILSASCRMQDLIDALLRLSRVGRKDLKRRETPIDRCLDQALETLAPTIEETGATIRREDLPTIPVDQAMISQVFQNLLSNAMKFVDQAAPDITVTCQPWPGLTVLGVQDNGIGIEEDYRREIFQPFERLHPREDYYGSGIGLSICHRIVDRHDGRIWVESEPGEGSHFKFSLPEEANIE